MSAVTSKETAVLNGNIARVVTNAENYPVPHLTLGLNYTKLINALVSMNADAANYDGGDRRRHVEMSVRQIILDAENHPLPDAVHGENHTVLINEVVSVIMSA